MTKTKPADATQPYYATRKRLLLGQELCGTTSKQLPKRKPILLRRSSLKANVAKRNIRGIPDNSCSMCGKLFSCAKNCQSHQKLHGWGRRISDGLLADKYHKFFMKYHRSTHMVKAKYRALCSAKFTKLWELRRHYRSCFMNDTGAESPFSRRWQFVQCLHCCKLFSSKLSRRLHTACHRRRYCKSCGKKFFNRGRLMLHIKNHTVLCTCMETHDTKTAGTARAEMCKNTCSICKKSFSSKSCLNRHQRVHTGEKPYMCEVCGDRFKERALVKKHMVTHTGTPLPKNHKCTFCDKSFTRSSVLQLHLKGHGEKIVECPYCKKKFPHQRHLKRHLTIHEGERKFQCNKCDKNFLTKANLQRHDRTHTGDKPFVCGWCGKRFGQSGNLKIHERVHTEEKPYECSTCGRKFTQSANLKHHMLLHEGKLMRRCKECGKEFTNLVTLQRHELAIHQHPPILGFHNPEQEPHIIVQSPSSTNLMLPSVNVHAAMSCHICGGTFNEATDFLHHLQFSQANCNATRLAGPLEHSSHQHRNFLDSVQNSNASFNVADMNPRAPHNAVHVQSPDMQGASTSNSNLFTASTPAFYPGYIIQSDHILSSSDLSF